MQREHEHTRTGNSSESVSYCFFLGSASCVACRQSYTAVQFAAALRAGPGAPPGGIGKKDTAGRTAAGGIGADFRCTACAHELNFVRPDLAFEPVYMSIPKRIYSYISISISISIFICISIYLYLYLSIYLSIYLIA